MEEADTGRFTEGNTGKDTGGQDAWGDEGGMGQGMDMDMPNPGGEEWNWGAGALTHSNPVFVFGFSPTHMRMVYHRPRRRCC